MHAHVFAPNHFRAEAQRAQRIGRDFSESLRLCARLSGLAIWGTVDEMGGKEGAQEESEENGLGVEALAEAVDADGAVGAIGGAHAVGLDL